MTDDLKAFSKRMSKLGTTIEVNAAETARNTASRISQSLTMEDTPVKSGRARNNWNASVGSPIYNTSKEPEYDKTGAEQHGKNNEVIATQQQGETIYITNALPYIGLLNAGSSVQAPAGFVEAAVQKANAFIAKASLLKPLTGGRA